MRQRKYLLLIPVFLSDLFFKTYQLSLRINFGWDQERDAQIVWQILKQGKFTLIGPSASGYFFLGPLWYYLLVPFYALTNLDPLGAAIFSALASFATTAAIFLIFRRLTGFTEAVIGSFIWSTFPDRTLWNPSLVPIFTVIFLWLCHKIISGSGRSIIYAFILFGLSLQIHFQCVALVFPLLYSLYHYYRRQEAKSYVPLLLGLLLLGITFTPLLAFDLRHDFVNSKSFISLFTAHKSAISAPAWTKFISEVAALIPQIGQISASLWGFIILGFSIFGLLTSSLTRPTKKMLLVAIFFPQFLFSFYGSNLSEYYFSLVTIPVLLGLSLLLKRQWPVALVILSFVFYARYVDFMHADYSESAYYKKQAVFYIANQNQDPIFNVSYSMPVNSDGGFRYLFHLAKREPQNIPEGHLWSIVIPPEGENVPPVATFGHIGVIRR
jgi:hypothetical protein